MANSYDQVYHTVSVNLILVSQCRHRATRSITVWQSIALNPHIFPSEWFAFTHLCPSVELRGGRRKCLGQEHILRTSVGLLITSFSCTSYPRYIQVGTSIVAEFPLRFLVFKLSFYLHLKCSFNSFSLKHSPRSVFQIIYAYATCFTYLVYLLIKGRASVKTRLLHTALSFKTRERYFSKRKSCIGVFKGLSII